MIQDNKNDDLFEKRHHTSDAQFISYIYTNQNGELEWLTYHKNSCPRDFAIFETENKLCILRPDNSTIFSDPFKIQKTDVLIASHMLVSEDGKYITDHQDHRHTLKEQFESLSDAKKILYNQKLYVKLNFILKIPKASETSISQATLETPYIDHTYDIRSEILFYLDQIKVRPISHNLIAEKDTGSKVSVSFSAGNILEFGDAIQKARYCIKQVSRSYNYEIEFDNQVVLEQHLNNSTESQRTHLLSFIDDSLNETTENLNHLYKHTSRIYQQSIEHHILRLHLQPNTTTPFNPYKIMNDILFSAGHISQQA